MLAPPSVLSAPVSPDASELSVVSVTSTTPENVPAANETAPVVVSVSFPKSSAPPESVILPLASVRFPIVEPVAAVIVPVNVELSSAVIAPTLIEA